jgi:hypothetical protein
VTGWLNGACVRVVAGRVDVAVDVAALKSVAGHILNVCGERGMWQLHTGV